MPDSPSVGVKVSVTGVECQRASAPETTVVGAVVSMLMR